MEANLKYSTEGKPRAIIKRDQKFLETLLKTGYVYAAGCRIGYKEFPLLMELQELCNRIELVEGIGALNHD